MNTDYFDTLKFTFNILNWHGNAGKQRREMWDMRFAHERRQRLTSEIAAESNQRAKAFLYGVLTKNSPYYVQGGVA